MELQEVKKALDDAGRLYKGQFERHQREDQGLEAAGARSIRC
jgi:hypothetical protein